MLRNGAREKALSRKVMLSLLMAGTMSVCISGGDVWAAAGDLAAQGQATSYTSEQAIGNPKIIGGWDFYKENVENLNHTGINTDIVLSDGKFDEIIGGSHIKQPGVDTYNVTIGNTSLNMTGGEVNFVVGGSKANNADKTTLITGNTTVTITGGTVNNEVIGGSYIKATGNKGAGTPALTEAITGNINVTITGGDFKNNVYTGSVADNYTTGNNIDPDKPILTAKDQDTSLTISGGSFNGKKIYGSGAAIGRNSEVKAGNATVILNAADTGIDCIYGGGYAGKGGKIETGNTHIVIDIAGNGKGAEDVFGGNSVYAYPGGTNAQGIVGDTLIEYKNGTSRGMIFGGSEIMGYTSATDDISKIESGNTAIFVTGGTLTEAVLGGSKVRLTGDQANKISSTGKATTIIVDGDVASVKGLVGGDLVQVLNKTYDKPVRIAEGSVEKTNITVNGGTVGTLYVDAGASIQIGDAGFKGAIIGGGVATGGTDNNKYALSSVDTANVVINDGVVNGDVYGGGLSTATLRSGNEADGGISTVASANVTINGGIVNGDIYGGGAAVGAANGTTTYSGGRSTVENATVNITGGTVNGSVYAGGYTSGSSAESKITNAATVNLTAGNVTGSINGSKDIVAGLSKLKVSNYQGNVGTIKNFDEIELTDSDFSSDLVLNGSTARTSGQVTLRGQLEILSAGGQNTLLAQGEKFSVIQNAYGSPAVYLQTGSKNEEHNNLFFNAKTTEIITDAKGYAAGIQVNSNSQVDGKSSNRMEFNGSAVKIDVNSDDSKATGLKISHSDYGGTLNTDIVFNSAVTEIRAHGNVSNEYYDQVAGIWEGAGSFRGDITTAVTFTGTANIEATSSSVGAYGVYLKGDGGTSTIDFQGDTNIQAYNGQTLGTAVYVDGEKRSVKLGSAGKTVSLSGDVIAKNDGVINIAGKTNTINGTISALNGGTVNLNGGSDAVYNININSFVTQGTGSNGSVKLNGGTMDFSTLNNKNLAGNSFVVNGGSLKAASEDIFTNSLTAAGTAIASGDVLSAVNDAVKFESGKLILSDEKYNLAWLKTAKEALNSADNGTMGLVVTGTLVTTDGKEQTEASASDLAATGAVHAGMTGKVDANDVTIGSSGLENLGVKDLALGGSAADTSKVTVGDGKELTLVGSGSENDALVKTSDGTAKNNVAFEVNAGTLNLGVAGANSGGNLNASVAITNDDSKVNVDAGTFKVDAISAEKGTISVNEGAALKTDSLTVGTEGSTVKLSGSGALEAQSMTVSTGTIEVTGTAKAGNLTVTDNNAKISVGSGDSAGSLVASNASLNGAAVVLDPVWKGNDTIGQASKAALTFTNNSVDGLLTVGRNSVLSLGTDDTGKAEQTFAESELTWGQNGVSAALYIDKAQTLDASKGGIYVDGTKDKAEAIANKANFAAGSLLIVNGSGIGTSGTAALTGGSGSTLTVSQGAKLYLTSTNAGTYKITDGFATTSSITGWDKDKGEVTVNKLSEVESVHRQDGDFTVTVKQKDVQKAYAGIALPNILQAMDQSLTDYAGIKYLTELSNDTSLSDAEFIAAVNGFAQGAENSGAAHSGTMAAFTIGDTIQSRMSLASDVAAPQGGKGKGTDATDNGSIWAQYIHNKDKVDNLGGISYDGQYNGVIIGGDFAPTGKYHSGVAFSYGSGSSTGSVSKNDFDFWGLSYYGSIKNDATNVIFDAGYSKTSNDIKGAVDIDSDTKVLTLGVKGEKLINNGHGTSYVPYAGLRYLNVDGGSYNGTIGGAVAAHYSADTANIWMLPLGIGVRNETITASGWKVRPMADIAYVWILGDKNSAMDVTVPGVNAADRLGYDIMDSGFFVGKLGIEAEKGDWTYGLGYAYQKGSHAQNSKFMLNVTYSF